MSHKALVADSDAATLQQIAALLTRAGLRVDSTREGHRAVSRYVVGIPRLAVVSERLPGLSGIQVCQQVRKMSNSVRLVLLFSRPLSELERAELAVDVGCDAVICRPFRASDLEHVLQGWGFLGDSASADMPKAELPTFALPTPIPIPMPVPAATHRPSPATEAGILSIFDLPPVGPASPLPARVSEPAPLPENVPDPAPPEHVPDPAPPPPSLPEPVPVVAAPPPPSVSEPVPVVAAPPPPSVPEPAPIVAAPPEPVLLAAPVPAAGSELEPEPKPEPEPVLLLPRATPEAHALPPIIAAPPPAAPAELGPPLAPAEPSSDLPEHRADTELPPEGAPTPDLDVLDDAAALIEAHGATAASPTLLPPSVPRYGDLRDLPLPRLIYELYVGTYFGVVHLRRQGVRRSIYFWAGMPVRVDTDQLSDSLGAMLVESGRIDEAQHLEAQRVAVAGRTHLGAALLRLGLLRESELLDALGEQTERKLTSTLAWRAGAYEVVDDMSFAAGQLLGETHPLRAIWRGVNANYESAALFTFFSTMRTSYIVATDLLSTQYEHLAPEVGELDPLSVLDGKTTFQDALARDATRATEMARALYVLFVTDMVRAAYYPGEPAPELEAAPSTPHLVNYQEVLAASDRIAAQVIRCASANHFEMLGVGLDATPEQVEAAWRAAHEPLQQDENMVGIPPEAVRRAREVAAALDAARRTLTDPARRDLYRAGLADTSPEEAHEQNSAANESRRARFRAEEAYREGLVHLAAGEAKKARVALEVAVAAHPEEATYRVGLAQVLLAGGHRKGESPTAMAYQLIDEALRLDPGNILASLGAARLMLNEGMHEEARPHVERVLQRAPHHRQAQSLLREIRLRAAE